MKSAWSPRVRFHVGLGFVLLLCAGCGPATGHVTGKVLMKDGTPLPGGTITFYSADGRGNPAGGQIHQDGTYEVKAAPVGPVKITISNQELKEGSHAPAGMEAQEKGSKKPNVADVRKASRGGSGPPAGIQIGPPREAMEKMAQKPPENVGAGQKVEGKYVPIDSKYGNPDQSGLTYEVKRGSQEHDIQLN